MPIMESTPERLVLKSGSTTLTLSRDSGKAVMQRKLLFWSLKPVEAPIASINEVTVDAAVDRASGVEVCSTMLVMSTGAAWSLAAADKNDAQKSADALRGFLAIPRA
jgi:hypothetical protein